MQFQRVLRRWVAAAATGAVLATIVGLIVYQAYSVGAPEAKADDKAGGNEWPMFGGSPARNLVNLRETKIATEADVTPKAEKNIKWSVVLGSKAYGGPVIAGGKIFIGTNNGNPRDPKITGDKGVLMCFEEKTGKFLWQNVHNKLEAGRVNDWPSEGICSSAFVDGDLLYYVNYRREVICADTPPGKPECTFSFIDTQNNIPHTLRRYTRPVV